MSVHACAIEAMFSQWHRVWREPTRVKWPVRDLLDLFLGVSNKTTFPFADHNAETGACRDDHIVYPAEPLRIPCQ